MNQELENRVMASIKLSDAQQEAKEIRINFFNKFSDAIATNTAMKSAGWDSAKSWQQIQNLKT